MNTQTTESTAKTPAVKTVSDDMKARSIFPTVDSAAEYLNGLNENLSDFDKYPLAAAGLITEGEDAGNFDASIYTDSFEILVAKLSKKGGGAKAIVVAPIPTYEALAAIPEGVDFIREIVRKELNHRAVRALRDAEDVSTVVDQIPTTVSGYIESNRGDGGIMEAFNELYKSINAALSKVPLWAKRRLVKQELKKAMESKGYANEYYGPLEDYKGQSLFVAAIDLGIAAAKRKGMDPTIFERWKATRDSKQFTTDDDSDDEDFSLDALTAAMVEDESKPTEEADPATDAATA